MEQNDGTPTGFGRGRPLEIRELRRPLAYTYAPPEYGPIDDSNNGMYAENSWNTSSRDMSYLASPSGDHARQPQQHDSSSVDKDKKPFQLSPYAKEFVPRNFRPAAEAAEESTVDSSSDSYPVQELRSFLNDITMNPGKFEGKIKSLTDTLNSMVDDDDTMRAVVNIIFDESVRQANLRYSGARLCKSLCIDFDPSPHRLNFRSVLMTRCNQEFKRREILAQSEDGGTYLRGFAMFLAELFSQVEAMKQSLGDCLPSLIKTILMYPSSDNIKCACQILKLVGAYLEDFERSKIQNDLCAPEMDCIICSLKNLAVNTEYSRSIRDMISSVIKLRDGDWGRPSHSENSGYDVSPPPTSLDEPVMYGPDGKPMTADELMFLQCQLAGTLPVDDDYDVYEDNAVDEMPEEISEAYEVFLRDHALRH